MAKEGKEGQEKKMSYDELLEAAQKLHYQNNVLKQDMQRLLARLQEASDMGVFKRIEFLFKVVESREGTFPIEFVQKCTDEICSLMTIPEQPEDKEADETKEE